MPDFAYVNTRIHAMRSRLFSRTDLEAMAAMGSLDEVRERLLSSDYQEAFATAAAQEDGGLGGFLTGLNVHRQLVAQKIIRMGGEELRPLLEAPFEEWHLRSILTLLRGIHRGRKGAELERDVIPAGRWGRRLVSQLSEQATVSDLVNLLVTLNDPYGRALSRVQDRYDPSGSLAPLEQALVEFYFRRSIERDFEDDESRTSLRRKVVLDIDFQNVLLAVKAVAWDEDRERVRESWIPRGSIPPAVLETMLQADRMEGAVQSLAGTVFQPALQDGLAETAADGDVAGVERKLQRVVLGRQAAMLHRDPLSLGTEIGYLALLDAEMMNLRLIAVGKVHGLSEDRIREELIVV
jgi:vacuolar-type H+-ATPase subunit C/Vma6